MSEYPVCQHCDYTNPADAIYCARCGRSLTTLRTRLRELNYGLIERLSPPHFGLLGIAAQILVAKSAFRIIIGVGFPVSLMFLFIAIGCASAYLGWLWHLPISNELRLRRFFLAVVGILLIIYVIMLIDEAAAGTLGDRTLKYRLPGLIIERTSEFTRTVITSNIMCWIILVCSMLVSVISDRIQRTRNVQ